MDYLDEKMIKIYENSDQFFEAKKNSRIILMTTKSKDSLKSFRLKKMILSYLDVKVLVYQKVYIRR